MGDFKQFRIVSNGVSTTYSAKDETARTSIGTLQTDLGTAQGNITSLQNAVGTLQTQVGSKIGSTTVSTVWTGTEAQYDLIDPKDPATLYFIEEE